MEYKQNERQAKINVICIYMYTFFQTFILFYAADTLFYIERGLDSSKYISFILIVNLIKIVLEIPSGIIADKYGKKKMLIISTILFLIEIFIFIISKSYIMFAIAMVISGIELALKTGIVNSIIYESLSDKKKFNKALLYNSIAFDISYMLAMILGGYIAEKYGLVSTYYLTIIPTILAICSLLFIKETNETRLEETLESKSISRTYILKNAIKKIISVSGLTNIFIMSAMMYTSIKILEDSHPEYASNIGISVFLIGIYTSFILIISMIGSFVGSRIKEDHKKFVININPIIIGLLILSIGMLNNVYGIVLLLLIYIFSESYENILFEHIHNNIDSKSRVTVESIYGLIYSFTSIVVSFALTIILKYVPLNQVYVIIGIFLILFSLICIISRKKYKKEPA